MPLTVGLTVTNRFSHEMNVFSFSQAFGVWPFRKFHGFSKTLFLFSCFFQAGLNVAWLCVTVLILTEDLSTLTFLDLLFHELTQAMNIICVWAHLANMNNHHQLMGKISVIIETENGGIQLRKYFLLGSVLIAGKSAPIILERIFEGSFKEWFIELFYFIIGFIKLLVTLQFCSILTLIRGKLRELTNDMNQHNINTSTHFNLVMLLRRTNRAFGWQLLSTFCQIFMSIVANSYWILLDIIMPDNDKKNYTYFRTSSTSAVLYSAFEVCMIIIACHSTSTQAEMFNVELFRLMRESKHLCENEKLYLYATMKNAVTFTACGFFNLGYPLITSIIAAAATYLVILLQFSASNTPE